MLYMHLKSLYILLLWDEKRWKYQLNPFDLLCCLRPLSPIDFLPGRSICWRQWGVKILNYDCISVSFYLCAHQDLLHIFMCSYSGCINLTRVMSSSWIVPCIIMWYSSLSFATASFLSLICQILSISTPLFIPPFYLHKISHSIPLLLVCVCLSIWDGYLEGSIYIGLVFLSIQLPYVFWLEHLSHLHLKSLLIDMHLVPFYC